MNYYVRIGGKAFGPLSGQDVLTLIAQERIRKSDPISTDGKAWREAGEFAELFPNGKRVASERQIPRPPSRKSGAAPPAENAPADEQETWYVSPDGRRTLGPYPTPTVISMLLKKELSPQSYVWRPGERMRPFRQEPLFYLFLPAEEPSGPVERPFKRRAPKKRASEIEAFESRIDENYTVYLIGFLVTVVLVVVGTFLRFVNASTESGGLGIIAGFFRGLSLLGILFCIGMSCVLLYRFWTAVQPYHATTTPGKAVGYCFIPFFNVYWVFICYFMLARDINSVLPEEWDGVRANEFDALTFCVLSVIPLAFFGFLAHPSFQVQFGFIIPFLFFLAFLVQPVVITSFKRAVFALVEME
ncbi:MAG: hypothetical protein J6S40_02610 [Thermoguttaceae bacterium]|nr:hypothetical protein [Thermoguttaceae bacterium]